MNHVISDGSLRSTPVNTGMATPLVLVHGFLGGASQWEGVVASLDDPSQVITVDLPGFSVAADLTAPESIEGFADSVIEQVDARSVKDFRLLGHSMGGMIAQTVAAKVPDRVERLVLYGTGPLGIMPNRFEPIEVSMDRLEREGLEASVRRIVAVWLVEGDQDPAFENLVRIGLEGSVAAARAALVAMSKWDGRANLPKLTMRSLVLWGDEDRSYRWPQVEQLWTEMPNSALAVIPGACHAAHLEKPEIFMALLNDFLRD